MTAKRCRKTAKRHKACKVTLRTKHWKETQNHLQGQTQTTRENSHKETPMLAGVGGFQVSASRGSLSPNQDIFTHFTNMPPFSESVPVRHVWEAREASTRQMFPCFTNPVVLDLAASLAPAAARQEAESQSSLEQVDLLVPSLFRLLRALIFSRTCPHVEVRLSSDCIPFNFLCSPKRSSSWLCIALTSTAPSVSGSTRLTLVSYRSSGALNKLVPSLKRLGCRAHCSHSVSFHGLFTGRKCSAAD